MKAGGALTTPAKGKFNQLIHKLRRKMFNVTQIERIMLVDVLTSFKDIL